MRPEYQLFASLPLVHCRRAPLDWKLEAALLHRAELKRCTECGGQFLPKSNRGNTAPIVPDA